MILILLISQILLIAQSQETITVTGMLVDRYCWVTNGGKSLDTGVDLTMYPDQHTLHCLVEVPQCKSSGYVLVTDSDANGEYEVLYTLDPVGNQLAINEMLMTDSTGRFAATGFTFTITGISDESTDGVDNSPILRTVQPQTVRAWGPLVDIFCWVNNLGLSLDNDEDLKVDPFLHTLYCLVEVEQCIDSGYVMVHNPLNSSTYDVLYTLDDAGNKLAIAEMLAVIEADSSRKNKETGYDTTIIGIDDGTSTGIDGSTILQTVPQTITVTGYLVDIFCWVDNGGISLDTEANLLWYPDQHTLFCLVDVDQCKDSGYLIVYQPDPWSEYEVLYTLDDAGNQLAIDEMSLINDRKNVTGFIFTITGIVDGTTWGTDGSPILQTVDVIVTTEFESESGSKSFDIKYNLLSAAIFIITIEMMGI